MSEYRFVLKRKTKVPLRWVKKCLFIMLNPSTADDTKDDPTIRRCIGFAERIGATDLTVVNLYAMRATNPKELLAMIENDPIKAFGSLPQANTLKEEIIEHSLLSHQIICAWGKQRKIKGHADRIVRLIEKSGGVAMCLGTTKDGLYPRHPLYLKADTKLINFYNGTET